MEQINPAPVAVAARSNVAVATAEHSGRDRTNNGAKADTDGLLTLAVAH